MQIFNFDTISPVWSYLFLTVYQIIVFWCSNALAACNSNSGITSELTHTSNAKAKSLVSGIKSLILSRYMSYM